LKKKWTILFFLIILSGIEIFGQSNLLNTKINLPKNKYRVSELLQKKLPQQNILLSYHDNIIPLKKWVEFDAKEVSIQQVLEAICHNENLSFEVRENQILIKYYDRPNKEYKYTISGRIKDKETGESLIGATILILDLSTGVVTNAYGFYSLTLSKGIYTFRVSYLGYSIRKLTVDINKNINFDILLEPQPLRLKDVTISEKDHFDLKVYNVLASTDKLDKNMLKKLPYLGEVDVFQGSLLLPGISNVGEGAIGINVRGGGADQNLIMLDEAVIYNSNHFFGLISVFNPDAVKDVEIHKGNFPASYGGRASSVMHIRQNEGNNQEFHVSGGIGLITSRVMLEGPIKKEKSSFLLSARSTFWDFILRSSSDPTINNIRANFQDLNGKMHFNINEKNNVYISGYFGSDANKLGLDALRKWGNRVGSIRWNRIYRKKHFSNLTAYFSQYQYRVIEESETADFVGTSRITDYALKWDLTSYVNPNNIYYYGASAIFHKLDPGKIVPGTGSSENELELPSENGFEPSLYFSNERRFGKFSAAVGFRASAFANIGASDVLIYSTSEPKSSKSVIDTLLFENGETKKSFFNLLPRISLKYQLTRLSSIKISGSGTVQYMHLLSNTLSPSSSDIWKISGEYLKPTTLNQYTIGFYKFLKKLDIEASAEIFYRRWNHLVDYKNGADLSFNESIETELVDGSGRAFGLELFVKRKFGKLTGWVGYTLSKAEKQVVGRFEEETINDGAFFPMDQDRRHDLAISAIYELSDRITLSSNFVYFTGRPFSFPDSKYSIDGILVPHYPNRNVQRLNSYHRLDISMILESKKSKNNGDRRKNESNWVFSIYNVYNRRNTQAYFFSEDPDNAGQPIVERYSVIGSLVPSITYNFLF